MINRKNYKIRLLFNSYPTEYVDFTDDRPFFNVNTPADLDKLTEFLQNNAPKKENGAILPDSSV